MNLTQETLLLSSLFLLRGTQSCLHLPESVAVFRGAFPQLQSGKLDAAFFGYAVVAVADVDAPLQGQH